MKNIVYLLLIITCFSCTTTRIKNESYTISDTAPELGSVGFSKVGGRGSSEFEVRTLPKLESPIRITIEVVPFNKRLHRIYKTKAKYNQDQSQVTYVDSLPKKPELVTIRILDVMKLVSEINGEHNKELVRFLTDSQKSQIVTSLAYCFSQEDIAKIKQADAFYLTNYQESKYAISLYKLGKKTETLFVNSLNVLSYRLSKFCWGVTDRGQWYVSDIIDTKTRCKGKTKKRISEKERQDNLFDL